MTYNGIMFVNRPGKARSITVIELQAVKRALEEGEGEGERKMGEILSVGLMEAKEMTEYVIDKGLI
tara:strand:+ start:473 stop:670 length:198 start_codon:yes stop_codon:yes gene_type:complete